MESRAAPSLGPIPAALPQPSALVQSSGHIEAKGLSSQLAQLKAWITLKDNLGAACPF